MIGSYISIYGSRPLTTPKLMQAHRMPKPEDVPRIQAELAGLWAFMEAVEAKRNGTLREGSEILQYSRYAGVDLELIGEWIDFLEAELANLQVKREAVKQEAVKQEAVKQE